MKHPRHALSHEQRQPILRALRAKKMASSAHRFVRGSTERFYEWLHSSRGRALPQGPDVWICGDCHIGNLGPIGSVDGRVEIGIRDLDQTVIGNPAHDVVRLGLSLAMAIRASDLPGAVTAQMIEAMVDGYQTALAKRRRARKHAPRTALEAAVKEAIRRSWRHLFEERLGDAERLIPVGRKFWPLRPDESRAIGALFEEPGLRKMVLALTSRPDDAAIRVIDAAFWVKGCSSLGLWRAAVLVGVKGADAKSAVSLVDIKEAVTAIAPRSRRAPVPRHNGERVVLGARALSPLLGDRMTSATLLGRSVFLRELLPQDLNVEFASITALEAIEVAHQLAMIVGSAHRRQLSDADADAWARALRPGGSKSLEAPSWLWRAVVDLAGVHESGYLEHCRRHRLAGET